MKKKSGLLTALLLVLALSLTLAMAAPVAADATFENFTEARSGEVAVANDVDEITVDTPPGTTEGDLLIGVVITDTQAGEFTAPAGWTELDVGWSGDSAYDPLPSPSGCTLGVWYLVAGAAEPTEYTWEWENEETVYAFIIRITGADRVNPIDDWGVNTDSEGEFVTFPSIDTTVDNALVLRIFGYDSCYAWNVLAPADHTGITRGSSSDAVDGCEPGRTGHCSGGAAYAVQATAGATGTAEVQVLAGELEWAWRAVTVAIRPYIPPAVGGTAEPINRMLLLAPWLALGAAIVAGSAILIRRRQTQS